MSDDPSPPATPASGNQNLVVGLVLGAVVLVLFLLLLNPGGGFLRPDGASSELRTLREQLDAKRLAINSERARLGLPPLDAGSSGLSASGLATRVSEDSGKLATLVGRLQSSLADKESRLKAAEETSKALTQRIADLQIRMEENRLTATEAQSLRSELLNAQALLDSARRESEDLRQRLAAAPDEAAVATMRQSLDDAIRDRDQARAELEALREQSKDMVAADRLEDYRRLKEKLSALVPQNNKLRYDLQRLQAELDRTRLFVEKVDDLPAAAKLLYTELAKLESAGPSKLKEEYGRIDGELKARVIDKITFPTGSSQIALDKVEEIRRATEAAGSDSFFLVVGYASKTGDLDANRKLSAARATTIASVTNLHLSDTQNVQAVFLGQTDRFSSSDPARNQVCEIWEIAK